MIWIFALSEVHIPFINGTRSEFPGQTIIGVISQGHGVDRSLILVGFRAALTGWVVGKRALFCPPECKEGLELESARDLKH